LDVFVAVAAARPSQTVTSRDGAAATSAGIGKRVKQERRDHLSHDRQLGPGRIRPELGLDGASVMDEHVDPVMRGAEVAAKTRTATRSSRSARP